MKANTKILDDIWNGDLNTLIGRMPLLRIYDGTEPATVNESIGAATKLIQVAGYATAGQEAYPISSGTAAWWRLVVEDDDDGIADAAWPRLQGALGDGVTLGKLTFTTDDLMSVSSYSFSFADPCAVPVVVSAAASSTSLLNGSIINGFTING